MQYKHKNWKEICELKDRKIKELEERLQQKWIPCSERLPMGNYETVLAVTEDDYYLVAVYTREHGFRSMDIGSSAKIIAWMKIPCLYVERTEMAADDAEWKSAMMRHFEKVE